MEIVVYVMWAAIIVIAASVVLALTDYSDTD